MLDNGLESVVNRTGLVLYKGGMGCAEQCRVSGTGGGWNSDETVTCCRED